MARWGPPPGCCWEPGGALGLFFFWAFLVFLWLCFLLALFVLGFFQLFSKVWAALLLQGMEAGRVEGRGEPEDAPTHTPQPLQESCGGTGGWCWAAPEGEGNQGFGLGFCWVFCPLLTTFWVPICSYLNKTFYGRLVPLAGAQPWAGGWEQVLCAGAAQGGRDTHAGPDAFPGDRQQLPTEEETGTALPQQPLRAHPRCPFNTKPRPEGGGWQRLC